ncbi:hypothetical protein D3C76_1324870 [compost metagenome]
MFQSGRPLNSSPSHHTVPASMASRSVSDIGGRVLRNQANSGALNSVRRRSGSSSERVTASHGSQSRIIQAWAWLNSPMRIR